VGKKAYLIVSLLSLVLSLGSLVVMLILFGGYFFASIFSLIGVALLAISLFSIIFINKGSKILFILNLLIIIIWCLIILFVLVIPYIYP